MSSVVAEPLAVFIGCVLGHADGRVSIARHAVGHGVIWWGRAGDEVDVVFDAVTHEV